MNYIKRLESLVPAMEEWRHHLHAYPETAFEEYKTAEFIAGKLASFGLAVRRGLAGTGVVGTLQNGAGRSILLRAEMDALDIIETGDLSYKSRHEGKMHACGHDGHMAMLLGAACYLSQNKGFQGTVHFLFQPAEENQGGGGRLVEEGFFYQFAVDNVYALHNFPGILEGCFATRPGPVMAACDFFDILVTGKGSHAGMPHLGNNPIMAASYLATAINSIISLNVKAIEPAVLSVTQFHSGSVLNVIPERACLRGTVRSYREQVQDTVEKRLMNIIDGISNAFNVQVELNYRRHYPAAINDQDKTALAVAAARRVAGEKNVDSQMEPQMLSEDFAFLLKEKPGCYMAIGNGNPQPGGQLHQSQYDFNDRILALGAAYWVSLVELALPVN